MMGRFRPGMSQQHLLHEADLSEFLQANLLGLMGIKFKGDILLQFPIDLWNFAGTRNKNYCPRPFRNRKVEPFLPC